MPQAKSGSYLDVDGPHDGNHWLHVESNTSLDSGMYQDVDLTPFASEIAGGNVTLTCQGWLQTEQDDWDDTRIFIELFDIAMNSTVIFDTGYIDNGPPDWTQFGLVDYTIPVAAVMARVVAETAADGGDWARPSAVTR